VAVSLPVSLKRSPTCSTCAQTRRSCGKVGTAGAVSDETAALVGVLTQ
jgi:hypothetical protein